MVTVIGVLSFIRVWGLLLGGFLLMFSFDLLFLFLGLTLVPISLILLGDPATTMLVGKFDYLLRRSASFGVDL